MLSSYSHDAVVKHPLYVWREERLPTWSLRLELARFRGSGCVATGGAIPTIIPISRYSHLNLGYGMHATSVRERVGGLDIELMFL